MTCQELKDGIPDNLFVFNTTRGFRIGAILHLRQCKGCQEYMQNLPPVTMSISRSIRLTKRLQEIMAEDGRDPEFLEAVCKKR